ncbi:hypothetical protein [Empedobacter brevis]|uniref:hypothetical protein n=1 Tax=Empedobacter brevis TaxID=247 RepID=UPI0039AF7414
MKLQDQAKKIFSQSSHDELWANKSGEFFSSKNLAELSLKKGQKLTSFKRDDKASEKQEVKEDSKDKANEQS